MTDPGKVAIAGDWHGNTAWACAQVEKIAECLADEPNKVIIHLGDFGFYPGKWGESYWLTLTEYLEKHNITLWALDGNHENHTWLRNSVAKNSREEGTDVPGFLPNACLYPLTTHIAWLSRGYRWKWHSKTWLALGGAASVDKSWRLSKTNGAEGINWWPEEEISLDDRARALEGGHADVMVTHEAPSFAKYNLPSHLFKAEDIDTANRHRERLSQIVDIIKPSHLFHGHLHLAKMQTCYRPWGEVDITALDCDGNSYNWMIFNTKTLEWANDFQ